MFTYRLMRGIDIFIVFLEKNNYDYDNMATFNANDAVSYIKTHYTKGANQVLIISNGAAKIVVANHEIDCKHLEVW